MKISQNGIDLIKNFEELRIDDYVCSSGDPTVGWGHKIQPGEKLTETITLKQAEEILAKDIAHVENVIHKYVKVALTQGQYDAIACLVFNVGSGQFSRSRGLKKLNAGDFEGAFKEFQEFIWVDGKQSNGLKRRRLAEAKLWHGETTIAAVEVEVKTTPNDTKIKIKTTTA